MTKLINTISIIGILFLIGFWIFNPGLGPIVFIVSLPFIAAAVFNFIEGEKTRKELRALKASLGSQKEKYFQAAQKKEKKINDQFGQLFDFAVKFSAALDREELLRLIVRIFAKLTQSTSGESQSFILLREPGTNEFIYEVGYNFDRNTLNATRFSQYDQIINTVVTTQKISLYMGEVFGGNPEIGYFLSDNATSLYRAKLGSLLMIPLIIEDQTWGIIVIFCNTEAAESVKNEEKFCILVAGQAAIALSSAIHRGLASVDKLTQLYNRGFLQKRMREEIEFCNRQKLDLSLLMLDIDNFKQINDTYGHQEGDIVLKRIAQIMAKNVRITDICARYGGEEFVVVLPGMAEKKDAPLSIAERLRQSVEQEDFIISKEKHIQITLSIGVALSKYPDTQNRSMDLLIRKADALLYQAKKEGRNKVCYSD